jgi:hypothetical protein
MSDYSPKRRTAVLFAGSGTSGAYHAGVLKALDESGAKIDLVVGTGVGTIAATFAAAAAGSKLYGPKGFWSGVSWSALYRLRPSVRMALFLLGLAFGVFLLPVLLAIVAGALFPLVLVADLAVPGLPARVMGDRWAGPGALRDPYIAALAIPVFLLSVCALGFLFMVAVRHRRRYAEAFESVLDAHPAAARLRRTLWEVCRGSVLMKVRTPGEAEVGRRFLGTLAENLGQPGFRELLLRAADLDTGEVLPFALLSEPHRAAFVAGRARVARSEDGQPAVIDLKNSEGLLFDAVLTGLLPPIATPVRRVEFPRGGPFGGEVHRLTEAHSGIGIADAMLAGADQLIVVTAVPEAPSAPRRRRGLPALLDATEAIFERQAVEAELQATARLNRIVQTVGHRLEDGRRAWQDPANGRTYREVSLWVIRPERRTIGPLEWDGSVDPATEVREEPENLIELGYRDAQRLFIEPVLGAPEPRRERLPAEEPVEL